MSELIGFIYAIIAAIFWGSYLVPYKKMKVSVYYSQFLMCLGIFLSTLVVSILFNFSLTLSIAGLAAGLIWVIGNLSSLLAIEKIGISRAFPIWISNTLVMFTWGVVLFKELTTLTGFLLGFIGVLLVFIGCVLIGRTRKEKEKSTKKGIIFALIAAVLFGSVFVPLKLSGIGGNEFYFQMSVGIILFSFVIFLLKIKIPSKLQIVEGLSSGMFWSLANYFGIHANLILGLSRGGPLTQICALIGTAWGLFYFKEFKKRRQIVQIIISTVIVLAGAFLIGLAGG